MSVVSESKVEVQMRRYAARKGHDVEAFITRWRAKRERRQQLSPEQSICRKCKGVFTWRKTKTYTCLPCKREQDRLYKPNREKKNAQALAYYYRNHEICKSRHALRLKEYRAKYPEKYRVLNNRRRVRKIANGGSFTLQEWTELCAEYGHRCLACKAEGVTLSIDHVVPLSMGGEDNITNIQPLCCGCNSRKGAKIIDYRGGVKS